MVERPVCVCSVDECVLCVCRSDFHRDVRHLRTDVFRQLSIQQVHTKKNQIYYIISSDVNTHSEYNPSMYVNIT